MFLTNFDKFRSKIFSKEFDIIPLESFFSSEIKNFFFSSFFHVIKLLEMYLNFLKKFARILFF